MKTKKAFTIMEAVITISILSVAFVLSAVAFSNLSRIQETATDQVVANRELNEVDELISRYISFVSIKTDDLSFSSESVNNSSFISFKLNNTFDYSLSFGENKILVSNTYSGDVNYLKYSESKDLKYINDLKFSFDDDLGLVVTSIKYLTNKNVRYSYTVRTHL